MVGLRGRDALEVLRVLSPPMFIICLLPLLLEYTVLASGPCPEQIFSKWPLTQALARAQQQESLA